jgi:hypothetical protein
MNRHGRRHVVATHAKTISMTGSDGIQSCRNLLHKDDCLRTPQSWQNDLQQMTPSARLVCLLLEGMNQLLGHSDVRRQLSENTIRRLRV